jgi:thiol-disulfide isomerase/thioredoxin
VCVSGCSEREASSDWTFVNYWAEWCKPCIKEIPELNRLNERDGYRVLGVNFDGATGEDLDAQIAALGVAFPTLAEDPGAGYGLDRPRVLPTTLVVAPDGSLRHVLVGPQTAESLIAATRAP